MSKRERIEKKTSDHVRMRQIVHDFYQWQKEHPGEDKKDPDTARFLLDKIEQWQRRDNIPKHKLTMYGFVVEALREGVLRSAPVAPRMEKNTVDGRE